MGGEAFLYDFLRDYSNTPGREDVDDAAGCEVLTRWND